MSVREANIALLKKNSKDIYHNIYVDEPNYSVLLQEGKEGLKLTRGNVTCYLSSVYDRDAELRDMFADVPLNTKAIIFFGCLDKALIQYLDVRFRSMTRLIIADPVPHILKLLFDKVRIDDLLCNKPGRSILLFPNIKTDILAEYIMQEVKFIDERAMVVSPSYHSLFGDYIQDYFLKFKDIEKLLLVNLVTSENFSLRWLINGMHNYANEVFSATDLISVFQGQTVIIVSAGPSLRKNVHLLKDAYDKAIIIAVGSSVPILNEMGIRPHFNAGLDLEQGTTFLNLKYPETPLLFGNKLSHETLSSYSGARFCFVGETDDLEIYLWGNESNKKYICTSGVSIATSILSLVSILGAKSVVFIGQDMCFYDGKLHHLAQSGDETVGADNKMTDIYGQVVATSMKYWAIKPYLEKVISQHPEVCYINATEGGLGLNGAENDSLAHVLDGISSRGVNYFKDAIDEVVHTRETFRFIDQIVKKNVLNDADKISRICKKIENYLADIGKLKKNNAQNKKIKVKISAIEKEFMELDKIEFYLILRKMMSGRIGAVEAQYRESLKSKSAESRQEALIKRAAGTIVPITYFCNQIDALYQEIMSKDVKR